MVVSQAQLLAWLGHFLWPFLRISGLFLTAPLYGSAMIPAHVKAVLAACYAASLALWLPGLPPFPGQLGAAMIQAVIQLSFGAALGLAMQMVVAAVAGAGEMVGAAIGLSFAELQFRESSSATPVLYDIMFWGGLMGFFAAGGPLVLFAAIAHSFAGNAGMGTLTSWAALAALGGNIIGAAVSLALPVLAVSLAVNVTIGLTTVFAPQMNLLSIGFPLLILAGLWMFAGGLGALAGDVRHLMALAVGTIRLATESG